MRKQTKLVAVLSAAALLAIGATMTSFAAWTKSDDGTWQFVDRDGEMVTGDWQKDGSKWFYLDDDGNMLTDAWVDDTYYVREDGSMIVSDWKKTVGDTDVTDPSEDGDSWYYFDSKGKKIGAEGAASKKIGGKTYYFDDGGKMLTDWQHIDGADYYLGGDDEGWRASGWLWLEVSDAEDNIAGHTDDNDDICDSEGWYYFGSDGKMFSKAEKKKVNGKYYFFNDHGQMLYEWINDAKTKVVGTPGNAEADGNKENLGSTPSNMLYMNVVEEGWRADGWQEISGSEDTSTSNDTDWYYFDKGSAKKATLSDTVTLDEDGMVYRARLKANNSKYFCFNQYGQMQTGLQYSHGEGFYYFDDNGYMKTGKIASVEEDNESYTYYFNTKTGKNGLAVDGVKDGYLYFNGKRLEADDEYRLFVVKGNVYLVNKSGKIQKSTSVKKYTIENDTLNKGEKIEIKFTGDTVSMIGKEDVKDVLGTVKSGDNGEYSEDAAITVPQIDLYDDVFTYNNDGKFDGTKWLELNKKK